MAADVSHGVSAGVAPAAPGTAPAGQGWTAGRVSRYLAGVSYTSVTALGGHDVTQHLGNWRPAPPASALDWAARARGAGTQTLRWTVRSGDWIVIPARLAAGRR